jgi:hypothetical protein
MVEFILCFPLVALVFILKLATAFWVWHTTGGGSWLPGTEFVINRNSQAGSATALPFFCDRVQDTLPLESISQQSRIVEYMICIAKWGFVGEIL